MASKVDQNGSTQRGFVSKLMNLCVAIATTCLITIVGFIWDMRRDFAQAQTKQGVLEQNVEKINDALQRVSNDVNDIKVGSVRSEERLNNLEKKVDKLVN